MKIQPLEFDCFYHVYNRGIDGAKIFFEEKNRYYFLELYKKYIYPVAETYSWCLMKNHFHFLIRTREQGEVLLEHLSYRTIDKPRQISVSKQFSNLFNSYALSINNKYERTGSLFEKPVKRKFVSNEAYLRELIYYIHNNPVHHNVTQSISDYKWTSYHTILSAKETFLQRKEVVEIFDSIDNFKYFHSRNQDVSGIEELLFD